MPVNSRELFCSLRNTVRILELEGIAMKKTALFVLIICLVMHSLSFGALNAYMRLRGEIQGEIRGGVTQVGREDSILVIGYNHDVFSPRDARSGLPDEARQHAPLRITKEIDRSTPLLMAAWAQGERITEFELRFWQPSATGKEVQYYTIRLYDARIVGIRQEMLNNRYPEYANHKEREHVTFVYREIEWIFEDGGLAFQDEWRYAGADPLLSDLSGDGVVNLLDLAIFASEWLENSK
jgi:type VI secretion system secreted protein Hcp